MANNNTFYNLVVDNERIGAKKYMEVDLQAKGTDLHDATVVGDTVGQAQNIAPYKWVECYRCYSAVCEGD